MVKFISTTLPIAFAAVASARVCQNITVEVEITARNAVFNIPTPVTNVDVTNFLLDLSKQGGNFTAQSLEDYADIGGTYQLASTYCEPDSGPGGVIQILTHGIGFDRTYWDFSANNYNYSYVGPVLDEHGFSTLAWDRLGIAESSRGEPLGEIQALARGRRPQGPRRQGPRRQHPRAGGPRVRQGRPRRPLVRLRTHVRADGHAPGRLGRHHPHGLRAERVFLAEFLLGGAFVQANRVPALKDYSNGYLASATEGAVQVNFFGPGNFDPAILTAAYETGQPVTVGELLTIAGEAASITAFTKPVLIVTGERDIPFCGGDCLATGNPELPSIPAASAMIFQNASAFEAYIVPDAGHGLTLSYSHDELTGKMSDFLYQNGLGCLI